MTRTDRAVHIQRRLSELYPDPPVPLDHKDPFTLLISVLLSAQCTDVRVNQITPALFQQADNPSDMSCLAVADIERIVKPCGLGPQKARAISGLSRILTEEYSGKVPADLALLEQLPGVGHKTAQVVMAQAFGVPSFPVDTHIHRLAQRWGLSNGDSVARTEADLKRIFPQNAWNKLHLQIIYYAREHCTARSCDGTVCMLCRECFPGRVKAVKTKKA